jgi:hypothetical protein
LHAILNQNKYKKLKIKKFTKKESAPNLRDQRHKENKRKGDGGERLQLTWEKMVDCRVKIAREETI